MIHWRNCHSLILETDFDCLLLLSFNLANRFVIGEHELDLHSLILEFSGFKACSDTRPPLFDPMAAAASDHFMACMVKLNQLQIILNFDLASW